MTRAVSVRALKSVIIDVDFMFVVVRAGTRIIGDVTVLFCVCNTCACTCTQVHQNKGHVHVQVDS